MATKADLDRINQAIYSGTLTVRWDSGRSITYRSIDDLMKVRSDIQKELQTTKRPKTYRIRTSKGL